MTLRAHYKVIGIEFDLQDAITYISDEKSWDSSSHGPLSVYRTRGTR